MTVPPAPPVVCAPNPCTGWSSSPLPEPPPPPPPPPLVVVVTPPTLMFTVALALPTPSVTVTRTAYVPGVAYVCDSIAGAVAPPPPPFPPSGAVYIERAGGAVHLCDDTRLFAFCSFETGGGCVGS